MASCPVALAATALVMATLVSKIAKHHKNKRDREALRERIARDQQAEARRAAFWRMHDRLTQFLNDNAD